MRINFLLATFICLTLFACDDGSQHLQTIGKLESELAIKSRELDECSTELDNIKNTAEQREISANKFLAEGNLSAAKIEFQGIVSNFPGTSEATMAQKEVDKIDLSIKKAAEEAERKKALGYKAIKPTTVPSYGNLKFKFEKIWKAKRWAFDDYGSEYRLRDAERGNKHVMARVSISSEDKNPQLPPVLVYKMSNGQLEFIGSMGYEFRRWKDYGAYLGNYADYRNDFAHTKTIPFNLGLQVSDEDLKVGTVYVVLKKDGCFYRSKNDYGNPEIRYKRSGTCDAARILKVEDFDSEYVLLKIL